MSHVLEFFEWDSEVEETEGVLTVIEIHLVPSDTLTETEGLLAVIGSSGYLEISLKEGDAGAFLHAGVGDEVIIKESASKLSKF